MDVQGRGWEKKPRAQFDEGPEDLKRQICNRFPAVAVTRDLEECACVPFYCCEGKAGIQGKQKAGVGRIRKVTSPLETLCLRAEARLGVWGLQD